MSFPVTCVIPAHNAVSTLERAVRSAYAAGCYAVIVCEDASSDPTADVCERLADEYSNFTWFQNRYVRFGATVARNMAIENVEEDSLVICLDADDMLYDLKPILAPWQAKTWVYGNHIQNNGGIKTGFKGAPIGMLSRKEVTGVTFLFHRDDWLSVGGFDPDFAYCEDYAFQCALQAGEVQGVYVNTTVYERFLKPEGNERTFLAGQYWSFYHQMAARKYPALFTTNR